MVWEQTCDSTFISAIAYFLSDEYRGCYKYFLAAVFSLSALYCSAFIW